MTDVNKFTDPHVPSRDDASSASGDIAPELHLEQFCDAVLKITHSGADNGAILTQVLPSLVRAIGVGSDGSVARLQQDLSEWTKASEQLGQLAVLHCGDDAEVLLSKLERTRVQATRIINALQALHSAFPQPVRKLPNPSQSSPFPAVDGQPALGESLPAALVDLEKAAALFNKAEESYQQKDLAAAEILYSEALSFDSKLRLAYLHRGRIRLLQGRADQSIDDLTRALELNCQDPLAFGWRGDAHAVCGRNDEAVEDYTRALELSPDLILMRYNRAVALRQAGNFDRALAEFDQLVRIKPAHCPLYLNRGLIWLARDNLQRAAAEFRMALRYQPDSQEAIQNLMEIEARLGRSVEPGLSTGSGKMIRLHENLPAIIAPANSPAGAKATAATVAVTAGETQAEQVAPTLPAVPSGVRTKKPARKTEPAVDRSTISDDEIALTLDEPPEPARPVPALAPSAEIIAVPVAPMDAASGLEELPASVPMTSDPASNRYIHPDAPGVQTFSIRCPSCGYDSMVRWDKLQLGKVLNCPKCSCHFTTLAGGQVAEVAKDRKGRWKEKRQRPDRAATIRFAGATAATLLLIAILAIAPTVFSSAPAPDSDLPKELEPRARLFATAWLKGDYRTMQLLTEPSQGEALFNWYRENQVPAVLAPNMIEKDVTVKVVIPPGIASEATARLRVKFDGFRRAGGGDPGLEMTLAWGQLKGGWIQKGGSWNFQPLMALAGSDGVDPKLLNNPTQM